MPYLLISLGRAESVDEARRLTQRYSRMALLGAAVLVLAGVGLAWLYVASWSGLYGTAYGVMVVAKSCILLLMVALGAGNWLLVQQLADDPEPLLARLRRVGEAEICLGFLAVLTAASLTGQPPAADLAAQGRLTPHEIFARLYPELPRMTSPPITALAPPSSMAVAVQESQFVATVGSDTNDKKWSEYNHHWAGLIVLITGLLALISRHRTMRWARFWPLSFIGLAVFILLRADPENWPLGPRPFWESFSAPDVLQHRFGALLVTVFAVFECAVQAGKLRARWAILRFSCCVFRRCRNATDARAFGHRRQRGAACGDEPHFHCSLWGYSGMGPMAGATAAPKPHSYLCRIPLADVSHGGRLDPSELP